MAKRYAKIIWPNGMQSSYDYSLRLTSGTYIHTYIHTYVHTYIHTHTHLRSEYSYVI
jgi:hypothetical protein